MSKNRRVELHETLNHFSQKASRMVKSRGTLNCPVTQTFLSASSRDIPVPCFGLPTDWGLEGPQNPQAGKPALPRSSWSAVSSRRNAD